MLRRCPGTAEFSSQIRALSLKIFQPLETTSTLCSSLTGLLLCLEAIIISFLGSSFADTESRTEIAISSPANCSVASTGIDNAHLNRGPILWPRRDCGIPVTVSWALFARRIILISLPSSQGLPPYPGWKRGYERTKPLIFRTWKSGKRNNGMHKVSNRKLT